MRILAPSTGMSATGAVLLSPMRTTGVPLCIAMWLSLGYARSASATELVSDRRFSDPSGEAECRAENESHDPAIVHEREERLPAAPTVRLEAALGGFAGMGTPGGVGGYLGSTPDKKTPVGIGYGAFASADVMALRPFWLNAQLYTFGTPRLDGSAIMGDVLAGFALSAYGSRWSAMHVKHHPGRIAYGCILSRADVAFVGGAKTVSAHGDGRVAAFSAVEAGVQLRLLRDFYGHNFGIDMDFLGIYDPAVHGAGMQVQDVLHVGKFIFTQTIGGVWKRGTWVFLGIGSAFDL
jgi:hypothetical protein